MGLAWYLPLAMSVHLRLNPSDHLVDRKDHSLDALAAKVEEARARMEKVQRVIQSRMNDGFMYNQKAHLLATFAKGQEQIVHQLEQAKTRLHNEHVILARKLNSMIDPKLDRALDSLRHRKRVLQRFAKNRANLAKEMRVREQDARIGLAKKKKLLQAFKDADLAVDRALQQRSHVEQQYRLAKVEENGLIGAFQFTAIQFEAASTRARELEQIAHSAEQGLHKLEDIKRGESKKLDQAFAAQRGRMDEREATSRANVVHMVDARRNLKTRVAGWRAMQERRSAELVKERDRYETGRRDLRAKKEGLWREAAREESVRAEGKAPVALRGDWAWARNMDGTFGTHLTAKDDAREEESAGEEGAAETDSAENEEGDVAENEEAESAGEEEADAAVKKEADAAVKKEADAVVKKEADAVVKKEADAAVKKEADAAGTKEADTAVKKEAADTAVKKEADFAKNKVTNTTKTAEEPVEKQAVANKFAHPVPVNNDSLASTLNPIRSVENTARIGVGSSEAVPAIETRESTSERPGENTMTSGEASEQTIGAEPSRVSTSERRGPRRGTEQKAVTNSSDPVTREVIANAYAGNAPDGRRTWKYTRSTTFVKDEKDAGASATGNGAMDAAYSGKGRANETGAMPSRVHPFPTVTATKTHNAVPTEARANSSIEDLVTAVENAAGKEDARS